MLTLRLYQVDAFTRRVFGGNPAAVCPVESCITMVEVPTGKPKESWEQRTSGREYARPGQEFVGERAPDIASKVCGRNTDKAVDEENSGDEESDFTHGSWPTRAFHR